MENTLNKATSAYLRQHATNPVHWQPWGDEALSRARDGQKLMIVSIGYAACHWCHVMEHESFSNPEVAELMNRHFIAIKVDREERPDIDQQYMAAVMRLNGNGGWPLNCITLPDGRPVFGGTYFRKDDWMMILERLAALWQHSPDSLIEHATVLTEEVARDERVASDLLPPDFSRPEVVAMAETILRHMDPVNGGTRGAPKFPMPPLLTLLTALSAWGFSPEALPAATLTLRKMLQGGIHDHLGGGFARYAVDAGWRIPHFEKMLYDNAQLAGLYARAYAYTGDDDFRLAAYGILHFLQTEMQCPDGGFYGSVDADSEGEEGRYYTWTADEIREILGADAPLFMQYYNCKEEGNADNGRNILYTLQDENAVWGFAGVDPEEGKKVMDRCRKALLARRGDRIPPFTDKKQVTSWNALLVSGLVEMSRAFNDPGVLSVASRLMEDLIARTLLDGQRIRHLFGSEDDRTEGFLDDYAAVILALTDLYGCTFDEALISTANKLLQVVLDHFPDHGSGLFFYIPDDMHYPVSRKMELYDQVTPSSNAMMAVALHRMAFYAGRQELDEQYRRITGHMKSGLLRNPASHGTWGVAMLPLVLAPWEVAISGNGARECAIAISRRNIPGLLVRVITDEAGAETAPLTIVPCRSKTCHEPVHSAEALYAMIDRELG
jgi:uncharacterized protein